VPFLQDLRAGGGTYTFWGFRPWPVSGCDDAALRGSLSSTDGRTAIVQGKYLHRNCRAFPIRGRPVAGSSHVLDDLGRDARVRACGPGAEGGTDHEQVGQGGDGTTCPARSAGVWTRWTSKAAHADARGRVTRRFRHELIMRRPPFPSDLDDDGALAREAVEDGQ